MYVWKVNILPTLIGSKSDTGIDSLVDCGEITAIIAQRQRKLTRLQNGNSYT